MPTAEELAKLRREAEELERDVDLALSALESEVSA